MIGLVDGDLIRYKAGWASQQQLWRICIKGESEDDWLASFTYAKEADEWIRGQEDLYKVKSYNIKPLSYAKIVVDSIVKSIGSTIKAKELRIYLSPSTNFRNDIATILPYKGNRSQEKPHWHEEIKQHLIDRWGAVVVEGIETDDMLGIEQYRYRFPYATSSDALMEYERRPPTIICSYDKDLDMIEGWHYNFDTNKKYFINSVEAWRNYYKQCLKGDSSDNIPGMYAILRIKCLSKYLDAIDSMYSMYEMDNYVKSVYTGHEKELEEIKKLLWILRTDGNKNPTL